MEMPISPGILRYTIRVSGHLDSAWSDWFDGFEIKRTDLDTLLVGPVLDQAGLHGLLAKIRDLGLVLLSVEVEDGNELSGGAPPVNDRVFRQPL
ncbi:MAG: hypothetical protein JXB85_03530 [Anaerolineales bacterium]|nr:hypothetical protein [Anaerolineales bacterium]